MRASTRALLMVLLCCSGSMRVAADAATPPLPAGSTREELYLQAFVNGVDQDLIVRVERTATDFFADAADLEQLGFKRDSLPAGASGQVAISAIAGVRAEYSPLEQRIDLLAPEQALAPQLLGSNTEYSVEPRSDNGLVFDYAFHLQSDRTTLEASQSRSQAPLINENYGRRPLSRSSEYAGAYEEKNKSVTLTSDLRWFSPGGLVFNRGYTTLESEDSQYVREDSFWTYTSLDAMRTYLVGDFISSSLTWTRTLRVGGARVMRNFGVRPDLVTFPLPSLGGTALVPTAVDLYVNGARQFSGEARPGPFLITDPPPITGAGEVAIVYRDELGRQVTTTRPLYVDTRLMDAGLSEYDVSVGYPRRNYGVLSADYGSELTAIGSLRYGVSDAFTLEAHTELGDELRNGGVGALLGISRFGVLTGAIAASTGTGDGTLTSAGYQYIARNWSIDLYDRRTHRDYQDLGTLEGVPVPQRLTRASINLWFLPGHALSANYIDQKPDEFDASRVLSLSYNGTWFRGRVSTYLSVFRDEENEDGDGAYLTVNISFGGGSSGYSSVSRYGEERTTTFGMNKPVDYDLGGFGWNVVAESGNFDYQRAQAQIDYRNRFMDLSLIGTSNGSGEQEQSTAAIDGRGALVYMKGGLFAAREIHDGFALVSTRGLPDVPVLRENRMLGRTNRRGFLLVPDLTAYRTSRIGIDLLQAPVDVSTRDDQLFANPREFSGVLVEFPIQRMRGATLILVDAVDRPLPVGTRVTLLGSDSTAVVGYGGQVFFPSLEDDNRVSAELAEGRCEVAVPFSDAQLMQTLGPFVCILAEPE